MITTGCEGCCFLQQKNNSKGCVARQLCIIKDNQVLAPGYCRVCRSNMWAKKQGTTDVNELYRKVIDERAIKFDMLVLFDEAIHTIEHLERTLNTDWYVKYAQKIIIVDTTGFGVDRKNIALQYIKSREHPVTTIVDSSAVHESEHEDSIRRVSKQVTSPFFLTISAGNVVQNFEAFAHMVQHVPSRVIQWSFAFTVGSTIIVQQRLRYGLFITAPYRALMKPPEVNSFTQELQKKEEVTEMRLSWFCSDSWLA